MEKKYISVDVETSGPTPGRYSMLSIGACIVGDTSVQFYREIQPLNLNYILPAMKIAVLGLRCLDDVKEQDEYNTKSEKFDPLLVLKLMGQKAEGPISAMEDYAVWIKSNTRGFKPVEAAAPIKFDGMFTAWYFDNFYEYKNPVGHSGRDIGDLYKGLCKNTSANIEDLNIECKELSHNALEDAIVQAKVLEKILDLIDSGK
jgi:ribonuclease T